MASTIVNISKGVWTEVTDTKNGSIRHIRGQSIVMYVESSTTPVDWDENTPTMEETTQGEQFPYWGVNDGEKVYAYAVNDDCDISFTPAEV